MGEELIQRNLINAPEEIGSWKYYNIGSTTLRDLKAAKIIPDQDYTEYESKKPDALIVKKPNVVAVIEYKQPKELRTKKQIDKAINQELEVAKILRAKIYIITDGTKSFWINPLTGADILDENDNPVRVIFDNNNSEIPVLINRIMTSITNTNNKILTSVAVDPLPLAEKVWQDLWSVSGATPENCLYTFVEIFIFKYLCDLGVLRGIYSFDHLIAQYTANNENEVLEFYAATVRKKIKDLFPGNIKDKTTIINGTIFVSKDDKAVAGYGTVFKKILQRFASFGTLENIDYDFKSKLFETFLKESISKKNWGQFFTPLKVIRAIIKMTDISAGMKICDPACGVGKFLLEPILKDMNRFYEVSEGKLIPKITLVGYDKGFDKDEQKTIILAKANMLIYMSNIIKEHSDITTQFAELFNQTFTLQTNSILGTLARPAINEYDLILTNPPYVMSGSSNLKDEIGKSSELKKHYSINAMGIEGLFMEWIIRALKPGGKAFIVVPDGLLNRQNDVLLRQFILSECYLDAIISLPINTFFTTNKKTYIMSITKKHSCSDVQENSVFAYLVSEIGESRDIYRFDIDENHLDDAANLFNQFKGAKSFFKTEDKRCKTIPISVFNAKVAQGWMVDRWWTEEEKIEMGIVDKSEKIGLDDFALFLGDISTSINEFQEELLELLKKKDKIIRFKSYELKDLFSVERGRSMYTRKYGNQNKGKYPVFSASNNNPLTYINTYDYEGDFLTWATNGFAGYMKVVDGKFSVNGDRGVLIPKVNGLNIYYIKIVLEPLLRERAKGRRGENGEDEFTKVYPSMIENIKISVPVESDGNFDIDYQIEIANIYRFLNDIKANINEYKEKIKTIEFSVDELDYVFMEVPLENIFDLQDGFAFSSNTYVSEDSNGIKLIRIQDINQKSEPKTVRIPRDYVFPNKSKFIVKKGDYLVSLSGAAGFNIYRWDGEVGYLNQRITKISMKDEYCNQFIDGYETILFNQIYNDVNLLGKSQNNNLSRKDFQKIMLKIPVTADKKIDKIAQIDITNKNKTFNLIKKNIIEKLSFLENIQVLHPQKM